MLMSQHDVGYVAPRLGLVVALATGEGAVVGHLAADRNPADAADVIAVYAAPGLYKVEAVTPDGEAFLSLF